MSKPVEPFRNTDINEGSAVDLELTHLDASRVLNVPTALEFRIQDLTNAREVLDWTTVTSPDSTNTIKITAAQNKLFNRSKQRELRQVTTNTTASTGEVTQEVFHYTLIRIFNTEDQLI